MIKRYLKDMDVKPIYRNEYIEFNEMNFILTLSCMEAFKF